MTGMMETTRKLRSWAERLRGLAVGCAAGVGFRCALIAACCTGWAALANAAKPTDPDVQAMIRRGIEFLHTDEALKGLAEREGSEILMAYAVFKVDYNAEDPVVARGIAEARRFAAYDPQGIRRRTYANYEMAVALLLLTEVDPVGYAAEIRRLRDMFLSGQRAHGGFGYYSEQQGDISQSQYAALALWTLQKNGFEIPNRVSLNLCSFFLRTQAPNGGWGYKGNVAPRIGVNVRQDDRVSGTLTMGGGGSVLIAGELFGYWTSAGYGDKALENLPKAFRVSNSELAAQRRAAESAGMTQNVLLSAVAKAERWLDNPSQKIRFREYYKIYTQERYESFLEIAKGEILDEPGWYNRGVADLKGKQAASGGWGIKDDFAQGPFVNDEPGVATAFAILFLIRSTKKAIKALSEGTARGGYEIPKDTTQINMEGGQIKAPPVAGAVDSLIGLLESDGADELDGKSIPEDVKLPENPKERKKQLDRLIRLVRGSQSWQARRVAARVLGQSGELRAVPALIYALSDPDASVRRFARDGLRFISRKFDGFGMPNNPTEEEWKAAQQAWRDWYHTIDPGYVFLDATS